MLFRSRDAAVEMLGGRGGLALDARRPWDPFAFIEACEQVHRGPDPARQRALEEVQRAEWQLLFDFCCRRAVEQPG